MCKSLLKMKSESNNGVSTYISLIIYCLEKMRQEKNEWHLY